MLTRLTTHSVAQNISKLTHLPTIHQGFPSEATGNWMSATSREETRAYWYFCQWPAREVIFRFIQVVTMQNNQVQYSSGCHHA
jgi:hypothetical protein